VQRFLVIVANLVAFALLAAVLAHWGWRWFGPAPLVLPPAPVADPVASLAASPPFGSSSAPAPVAGDNAATQLSGDTRLLGVFAEPGGKGHALFRMPDGSPRLVAAGESLGNQATLVAIRPDGVVVRDTGGERTIALRAPAPIAPVKPAGRDRVASSAPGCALPAGYKGPVVRLNAELVQGLMSQPEGLRAIADAQDGGLVIRDEAGFAALLGMKKGDRVTQANGIALRAPEDVIVAVLRPLASSQMVRLVGTRGGEPRELVLVNAGACPS
jgi:type II secretory pathway component PulC